MELTKGSKKSKTYYWEKYGLIQTCSFQSDLTVPYILTTKIGRLYFAEGLNTKEMAMGLFDDSFL